MAHVCRSRTRYKLQQNGGFRHVGFIAMCCVLKALPLLRRLNLSYCNVRNHLSVVLYGVRQRLVYVNLKDTRLNEVFLYSVVAV